MSTNKTKYIKSTGFNRFLFLDIMKGYAVFFFILWHVFQNFYQYNIVDSPLYRLSFPVTGFFVFASGFLVGCKNFEEHISKENFIISLNRLTKRALKLIIIVFVANIAVSFLIYGEQSAGEAIKNSFVKIFSLFYVDRWDVSLQVLLAISLTLVLGYFLLYIGTSVKHFMLIAGTVLFAIFILDLYKTEPIPYLWRYVIHGIVGIMYGIFFKKYIISKMIKISLGVVLCTMSLLIFMFVEVSVIIYGSLYNFYLYKTAISVLASASCFISFGLLLFYLYDMNKMPTGNLLKIMQLAGANSLFVYLIQIVIIDIIGLLDMIILCKQLNCILLSIAIFSLTVIAYKVAEKARNFQLVDTVYKMVFQ